MPNIRNNVSKDYRTKYLIIKALFTYLNMSKTRGTTYISVLNNFSDQTIKSEQIPNN